MRYIGGVVLLAFGTTVTGVVAGIWTLQWASAQLMQNAQNRPVPHDPRDLARQSRYAHALYERIRGLGLLGAAMLLIGFELLETSHH